MKPRQKYLHLLEDPDVMRWYENVARGSITTAEIYLRRFFCSSLGSTPRELAAKGEDELHTLILDLISKLESEGRVLHRERCQEHQVLAVPQRHIPQEEGEDKGG
ncbi:MAG: hypothetical protein QXO54_01065 [Candidatus Methanomethylicaceae archaeon]|nr:hypothetical protein [Candidatus Verstraetearchaeota archaeon]